MEQTPVPPRAMLVIAMGFAAWSAAFVALYAINAVGCAFSWPAAVQRGVMIVLTLAACAAMAGLAAWSVRHWRRAIAKSRPAPSLSRIGAFTSIAAFAATLFVFAPSFFASTCV